MNREEFIAKLQMVYVGDRNAFNEIVGVYDNYIAKKIKEGINKKTFENLMEARRENQRLKECCTDAYETGQEIIKDLKEENQRLNNVLNEIYKFVDWHYEDNKKFFKNKGIGLNYPECDYILKIIKELKESDK